MTVHDKSDDSPNSKLSSIDEGFNNLAAKDSGTLEEIGCTKELSGSIKSFTTWVFAITSGTFIGLLLNIDVFVVNDRLAFKWLFLASSIVFGLSAFASTLFMVAIHLREVAIEIAHDKVITAPAKIKRRYKDKPIEEQIKWYQENTRDAIRTAVMGHNLLPKSFRLLSGSLRVYLLGLTLMAVYVTLFIVFKV